MNHENLPRTCRGFHRRVFSMKSLRKTEEGNPPRSGRANLILTNWVCHHRHVIILFFFLINSNRKPAEALHRQV